MSDPTLYLYTSLTAGSSHIVTATARIETILKANKLPFRAVDVATDDAARKLWGRRSKGKKLPGLVKYGDIVGDLEQIEEWNEFGELRLVILSVQDLGGMPATSCPIPATDGKTEPEPATPKPSTIKIQSPPTKTEEKKDDKAVLALRQASSEAASKAASKTEEKKEPAEKPAPRGHRGSVAAELPDTAPDSPKAAKRPVLIPEMAAVSSANFHAENAEALGLVEHHRGSIISTTDKDEQDKVVREIRASITADEPTANLDSIRKQAAEQTGSDTIEEVATPLFEDVNDTKMAAAAEEFKAEEPKTETKESEVKEAVKEDEPKESKSEEIKEQEDTKDKAGSKD
ncbi:hypothetical protein PENANT_c003G05770 [Penicillium antarcticum]|uniref:Glutaredoxin domain-containing protein n=1 Tax=Penicillium antarcticum TaxID=416450 RepID=A0A1V6QHL0_9EURO|nr:uncharacterized protein N7508_006034 [Penicillium antarcticum]KAJ5307019.1 hypothetical protein N7508_006034 [Penicillium antarcticum]OQD88714.1 hypothetical protein PENANT_c003G05770 [Penicillium antarcticum]